MPAELFGIEHFLYIGITTVICGGALILAKHFLKAERSQDIFVRCLGFLLLIAIVTNRLSQVFRYDTVRWEQIIPDSYCGMTSLVMALAVLLGKKDNNALHFTWILGILGGIGTVAYPTFIGQGPTIFYLPTISGLLHHSLCATVTVAVLLFGRMRITYQKWYCTLFGFTAYLSVGAFLIGYFGFSDAFHIFTPLIDNTPLTTWFMAPIYVVCYAALLLIVELVRKLRSKAQ